MTHALGRSRGGFGTKACLACDRLGRVLAFRLLPGHRSELKAAPALLAAVSGSGLVRRVVCDRAYSSAAWRAAISESGAEPVVPANRTHPAVSYDRAAYRRRHRVEQLWGRLKEWRAVATRAVATRYVATRYEKTAESYLGVLHVAAALDWIRHGLT